MMGGHSSGGAVESTDGSEGSGLNLKLSPSLLNVILVTVLLLVSLFMWTLPFQHNRLPYGEADSAWHFAIGDHISSSDKASFRLPYYIGIWYYGFNTILGPFAPEYPPSTHVNYAFMQILGGDRFLPILIFRVSLCFFGSLTLFFLISRLFGSVPGFLAALGMVFSHREQLTSLFGQGSTLIAINVIPVTVYAWYRYLASFYGFSAENGESKGAGNKVYLFVATALLTSQYLLHFQGFVGSMIIMAVLTAVLSIRFRQLPVSKSNFKQFLLCGMLFLIVAAPFALIYIGAGESGAARRGLGRLFEWGIQNEYVTGSFPPQFVDFSSEYPRVLVPFLFVGLGLLVVRLLLVKNNTKELLLLSWLIGTYLVLHLDVFFGTGLNRLARMLVLENFIFYSLIGLSVVWLPSTISSFLKLPRGLASAAKLALIAILVILLINSSGKITYDFLKNAYADRITPVQVDFADRYIRLLPEKAYVYDPVLPSIGGFPFKDWRYPKMRWMLAISQRHIGRFEGKLTNPALADPNQTYFLFDYSDIVNIASSSDPGTKQPGLALGNELRNTELSLFNNTRPLYEANNIRLYKYNGTSLGYKS